MGKLKISDLGKLNKFLFVATSAIVVSVLGYVGASVVVGGSYGGYGYGTSARQPHILVYRGWNPTSGDHFYTADPTEYASLPLAGYTQEGIAFGSCTIGIDVNCSYVYRAWNPGLGNHIFTTSLTEWTSLLNSSTGWESEGVAFGGYISVADAPTTVFVNPVFRNYKNAIGDHLLTIDNAERLAAVAAGWVNEGNAWFAPENS